MVKTCTAKKVLVVDDDPVIRILVSDYLSAKGCQVDVAENGQSCLEELEENLPDLVFLDLQMPDMNGLDVLRSIRSNPRTAELTVVMLSANLDISDLTSSTAIVPDGHITKPFKMDSLLEALQD